MDVQIQSTSKLEKLKGHALNLWHSVTILDVAAALALPMFLTAVMMLPSAMLDAMKLDVHNP